MERVTYVMADEVVPLPRVVEEVADEVIACVWTEEYFDAGQRAELGRRITHLCRQLGQDGEVPVSVAIALEKGLCGLLNDGW